MTKLYNIGSANKPKAEQTANPKDYPQGYFKDKPCKDCKEMFTPKAPSELYCSDECAQRGRTTAYLWRNYRISLKDYEKLLDEQDHLCKICLTEGFVMSAKHNNHVNKLVVDHCHTTGAVRGLLCHNCNRALGLLQDNIESLQRAIDYLKA